jgi:hypothetical protein
VSQIKYESYGTKELLIVLIDLLNEISAKLPEKPVATERYNYPPAPEKEVTHENDRSDS